MFYTPGPWFSEEGTVSGRRIIAPNAPKTRQSIAACGGKDREANADLIAAAPDLYEALAQFAAILDIFEGRSRPTSGVIHEWADHRVGTRSLTVEMLKAAKDALAKAEGRQP